jgi:hypothetical protein
MTLRHHLGRNASVIALICTLLAGCDGSGISGSGGSNPLLGNWEPVEGSNCPYERLDFSKAVHTSYRAAIGPNPPEKYALAVSYSVEGSDVIVQGKGTGAGAMVFHLTGPDTMQPSANEGCTYRRAH